MSMLSLGGESLCYSLIRRGEGTLGVVFTGGERLFTGETMTGFFLFTKTFLTSVFFSASGFFSGEGVFSGLLDITRFFGMVHRFLTDFGYCVTILPLKSGRRMVLEGSPYIH